MLHHWRAVFSKVHFRKERLILVVTHLKLLSDAFRSQAGNAACNLPPQGRARGRTPSFKHCVTSPVSSLNSVFKHFSFTYFNPFLGGKVKSSFPGFDLSSWHCLSRALAGKQEQTQRETITLWWGAGPIGVFFWACALQPCTASCVHCFLHLQKLFTLHEM